MDTHAVTELKLYIVNDGQLYRSQTTSIEENLRKKLAKGAYDHAEAKKLWGYLADAGAKKYSREFGGTWNVSFPPDVRRAVASQLADDFRAEEGVQRKAGGGVGRSALQAKLEDQSRKLDTGVKIPKATRKSIASKGKRGQANYRGHKLQWLEYAGETIVNVSGPALHVEMEHHRTDADKAIRNAKDGIDGALAAQEIGTSRRTARRATVRTIAGPKRVGGRRGIPASANARVRKSGSRWVLVVRDSQGVGREVARFTAKREATEIAAGLNEMTLAAAQREVGL
jgi:hypothetical protein